MDRSLSARSVRTGRPFSRGRTEGLAVVFDRSYSRLRRYAYLATGSDVIAEELVMDAFVKACSGRRQIHTLEDPEGFIRKIVTNLIRSRFRRLRVEERVSPLLVTGEASREESSEVRLDLRGAIAMLPPRQRLCVVLRYYEDLPESEIAALMDCSVGTVKSQLAKARRKLAADLTWEEEDNDELRV